MKLSKNSKKALEILQMWEDKRTVFNFEKIFSAAYFSEPKVADCCYLMELEEDFKASINKQFYEFSETGEGGSYALWNYPELEGEPPVIYFDSDKGPKMVAPSLEAFAIMFSLDEYIDNEAYINFKHMFKYYDLNSEDEAKALYEEGVKKYQKIIASAFDVKSLDEYLAEMNRHKNFDSWYAYIEENGKDIAGEEIEGNSAVINKVERTEAFDVAQLFDLFYQPINNKKITDVIEKTGLTIPKTSKRTEEKDIDAIKQAGILINFSRPDSIHNEDGNLVLSSVEIYDNFKFNLPFNLSFNESYEELCDKIGKKAVYGNPYFEDMRTWLLTSPSGTEYSLSVTFEDVDNLKGFKGLIFHCDRSADFSDDDRLENINN